MEKDKWKSPVEKSVILKIIIHSCHSEGSRS